MASFKILSSAFSDGFHVPLLKNDQNYDLYLSFCSHTPSALIRRSVSSLLTFYEIPRTTGIPLPKFALSHPFFCLQLRFTRLPTCHASGSTSYCRYATRFLDFDVTLPVSLCVNKSRRRPNLMYRNFNAVVGRPLSDSRKAEALPYV